jgi:small subunit ribosomal protein S3
MMIRDYFIKQGIKESEMEDFIRKNFPLGDYSRTEIVRTPLGTKIIIYTNKPGRIIGRGGKNINDITEAIKTRFKLENPQVDVKTIENPNLDAKIVAKQIASALERGYNNKKIANLTVKRVMESGAIGIEIVISGKITGSKAMISKVIQGYLKHSGEPSQTLVDEGFEVSNTKPGVIGIRVKIMKEFQDITGEIRKTVKPVQAKTELITESLEKGEAEEEVEEKTEKKSAKKPQKKKKEKAKVEEAVIIEDAAKPAEVANVGTQLAEQVGEGAEE